MSEFNRDAAMQEFWKTACEVDQAWLDFQKHATELCWHNWKKLKDHEYQLMEVLGIDRNGVALP